MFKKKYFKSAFYLIAAIIGGGLLTNEIYSDEPRGSLLFLNTYFMVLWGYLFIESLPKGLMGPTGQKGDMGEPGQKGEKGTIYIPSEYHLRVVKNEFIPDREGKGEDQW